MNKFLAFKKNVDYYFERDRGKCKWDLWDICSLLLEQLMWSYCGGDRVYFLPTKKSKKRNISRWTLNMCIFVNETSFSVHHGIVPRHMKDELSQKEKGKKSIKASFCHTYKWYWVKAQPLKLRKLETRHFRTFCLQMPRLQMGFFQTVVTDAYGLCKEILT